MRTTPIGEPRGAGNGVPACRAGDFVFTSGLSAPAVSADDMGYRPERQTAAIFDEMADILTQAGSSLNEVAKLQTFHSDLDVFATHLAARKRAFTPPLPPSTAVGVPLPGEGTTTLVNAIAGGGGGGPRPLEVDGVPQPLGPYSLAMNAPPFVFLAGVLASDFRTGVAAEATIPAGVPHFGSPIEAQTTYVLDTIKAILEGSGASLDLVVKTQVILTDIADFWGFERVWKRHFPADPPVRTVIQGGLVNPGCLVEVDVIAVTDESGLRRRVIETEALPPSPLAESTAVRAGDWVFVGGLVATDYQTGLAPEVRIDPNFPRYDLPVLLQGELLFDRLEAVVEAAGSSLGSIAHLWAFVDGGLDEFRGLRQVVERRLTDTRPALTTAGSRGFYVPDCVLAFDAIAVAG